MRQLILFLLCLALLMCFLAVMVQRDRSAQIARFSDLFPCARCCGRVCMLPSSSCAARHILRRIFGRGYVRSIPLP